MSRPASRRPGPGPPAGGNAPPSRPPRRPAPWRTAADPARRVAFDVLRRVDEEDAYANLVLPGALRQAGLTGRDAAFSTEITYGTLRRRGTYDAVLETCVDRPLDRVDPAVLDLLRLGAHQLLAMAVPDHAAVSATVALCRQVVGAGAAAFVNAVLRRVAGRDLAQWLAVVAPAGLDPHERLAVQHSHPGWVVRALAGALAVHGRPSGDLAALLMADNQAPTVTLAALPGLGADAALRAHGCRPGCWAPTAWQLPGGDPASLAPVAEGTARVQDEGSQLVALALANAALDGPDSRWADLCAGPGGKAALLAASGSARGAGLVAVDIAEHRVRLVRRALQAVPDGPVPSRAGGAGTPPRLDVRLGDGRDVGQLEPGRYDRVLVDVPCTGLGALRRRPEARWRRTAADITSLAPLQRDLLASALHAVRPGGLVGYATCSPLPAETVFVVDDVLRRAAQDGLGVERVDARPLLPGVSELGDRPAVQLWPHLHGTDAMYLALLRRT